MVKEKKSSCLFCSIGCGVKIKPAEDSVLFGPQSIDALEFDFENPVNAGSLCGRGVSLIELVSHPKRLFSPMIRIGSEMKRIDWNKAFNNSAEKLLDIIKNNGPESVGIILGPCSTNEEAVVAKDFADFLDIKNLDFLAPDDKPVLNAVKDFPFPLKSAKKLDELANANLSIIIGDLFFGYPVISKRILNAKYEKRGNKLITIDSSYSNTTWFGNLKLINKPGTEAFTLIGIIKKVLDKKEKLKKDENEIKKYLDTFEFSKIEEITYIHENDFASAAEVILHSEKKYIYLGSSFGVSAKLNIVAYMAQVLSFITDSPFIPLYSGGNSVGLFNEFYNSAKPIRGLSASEMIDAAVKGKLKGLMIFGCDPFSALPSDLNEKVNNNLEFLMSVNIFPTEVTEHADIEFPASSFFEKEGTATNFFNMKVNLSEIIAPFGQTKPGLFILQNIKDYVIKNRWKVSVNGKKTADIKREKFDYRGNLKKYYGQILSDKQRDKDYFMVTHFHPGSVGDGSISRNFWWSNRDLPEPFAGINENDPLCKYPKVKITGKNGELVLPLEKKKSILPGMISVPVHFKDIRNFFSWEIEQGTNYVSVKPEKVKLKGIE